MKHEFIIWRICVSANVPCLNYRFDQHDQCGAADLPASLAARVAACSQPKGGLMSNKVLKKLSSILVQNEDKAASADAPAETRLNTVLEDHLDLIAAAYGNYHGSVHGSQIN